MRQLPRIVAETPIDKTVEVVVWRDRAETIVNLEVGELDEQQAAAEAPEQPTMPEQGEVPLIGLSVASLTPEIRLAFEIGEEVTGVVITEVEANSSAAEKGLQPGDVIIDVDQKPVVSPADVDTRVQEARDNGQRVVTLLIERRRRRALGGAAYRPELRRYLAATECPHGEPVEP